MIYPNKLKVTVSKVTILVLVISGVVLMLSIFIKNTFVSLMGSFGLLLGVLMLKVDCFIKD